MFPTNKYSGKDQQLKNQVRKHHPLNQFQVGCRLCKVVLPLQLTSFQSPEIFASPEFHWFLKQSIYQMGSQFQDDKVFFIQTQH